MSRIFALLFLFQFSPTYAQREIIDEPVKNFEMLWQEFNLRYANFELKQVNWKEVYDQYRPYVDDQTTNEKLFETSCMMLQELSDGHVSIEANFEEEAIECGPPYEFKLEQLLKTELDAKEFRIAYEQEFERNGFSASSIFELSTESNIQSRSSEYYAYLRLDDMYEAITFGKYTKLLNDSFRNFQSKQGLIIDLRFNEGGWDFRSYQLAKRLISKNQSIGHYKRTKVKGKAAYTNLKHKKVKSIGKRAFNGEIVILTSDYTASAAEVFVLMMKDLPNVTIIGDNTEGIFSDMYEFELPNKWQVSLSHQQFFSKDKINYEGKGIEPDIYILNSFENIQAKEDPVIQTAIKHLEMLRNQKPNEPRFKIKWE